MAAKRNKDTLTKAGEAVTSAAKTAAAVAQEYVVEPAREMLGLSSDAASGRKKGPARTKAAGKKSRPAAAAPRKRPAKKARKKAKSK